MPRSLREDRPTSQQPIEMRAKPILRNGLPLVDDIGSGFASRANSSSAFRVSPRGFMQSQFVVSRTAAQSPPVAAMALFALAWCALPARAQLTVGPITIDVSGSGKSNATAHSVLAAIGAAERAARERRGGASSSGAARVLPTAERYLG